MSEPTNTTNKPVQVLGYTDLSETNKKLANEFKQLEEQYLRLLEYLIATNIERDAAGIGKSGQFDQRCIAEARTCIQTGNMWAVRAIFQPQRIALPGDNAHP